MPHVDEGLLHAYIDGAFDAESPERIEIERHLAACGDCRVLLERAEKTKQMASQALDAIAPAHTEPPAWESVLAEHRRRSGGGAVRRSGARRWYVPVTWAATLVMALGAGWMARAMLAERDLSPSVALQEAAPARDADDRAVRAFDSAAAPPASTAESERRELAESPPASALVAAPRPEEALPAPAPVVTTERPELAAKAAGSRLRASDSAVDLAAVALAQARQLNDAMIPVWVPVSLAEAADSLGTEPAVVVDASPDSVFLARMGERAVIRMYYHADGETIELQQSRAVAADEVVGLDVPADSTSSTRIRDLVVILRGPPDVTEAFRRRLR